ncbi:MAG: formylglycine-generating enzyme family protein [Chloroflexaceae bacterium]|nr:formylglycine-generating enzyme family protein [Chloroflexaceae bacterium]
MLLLTAGRLRLIGVRSAQREGIPWLRHLLKAKVKGTQKTAGQRAQDAALAALSYRELGEQEVLDEEDLDDLLRDAIVALLETSDRGVVVADRVEAARVLGDLGDPRIPVTPEEWSIASAGGTTDPLHRYWCCVEAGSFWFGDDRKEKLQQVRLPYGFAIARYPLTNAQYARFIEVGGYEDERWWTKQGWASKKQQKWTQPRFWNDTTYNHLAQPVVSISWYEVVAYCCWLTAQGHAQGWLPQGEAIRLPTSLEWERAARGTDRRYPWGSEQPTPEHANYGDAIGRTTPVGVYPLGAVVCGALDMAGNVWEWTATPHEQDAEPQSQGDFAPGDGVQLRGGAYYSQSELVFCGSRFWNRARNWDHDGGGRLLRSLCQEREEQEH